MKGVRAIQKITIGSSVEFGFGRESWKPGRITGFYTPTEFAGAISEAFATIDVGTMAEYEVYRTNLAAHPRHQQNVRKIEASGAIHSIYRAIIE